MLKVLGVDDINTKSYKFYRGPMEAHVTLENICDKIKLMSAYRNRPVPFTIEEIEKKGSITETFYSSSCKFALGISKYTSTTLTLGELGRFPIEIKIILLNLFYWLRLEQGSSNPLLDQAFLTMKRENHPWLENVKYLLFKIGCRDIWEFPTLWTKTRLKYRVKRTLEDMHAQLYSQYIHNDKNLERCQVMKICQNSLYKEKEYLNRVHSPLVRCVFSKLRLDANCTLDSIDRGYRGKKSLISECNTCKVKQTVQHILFECQIIELGTIRNKLEQNVCNIMKKYKNLENSEKLKQVLSLEPDCLERDRTEAERYICAFVYNIYGKSKQLSTTRR